MLILSSISLTFVSTNLQQDIDSIGYLIYLANIVYPVLNNCQPEHVSCRMARILP
jgi:hypothetical protein